LTQAPRALFKEHRCRSANAFWGFSAEKIARPIRIRAISSVRTWIHGLWELVGVLSATPLRINIVIILSRPEAILLREKSTRVPLAHAS
jgi:hypothetical protein